MTSSTQHDRPVRGAGADPAPGLDTDILVAREAAVALVTLNRPERRNAMSLAMWRRLGEVFHGFARERELRAVILTGAGGHFCAGADIGEFGKVRSNAELGKEYERAVDECQGAIAALPQPTIAAIAGFCVGGGCGIALACDLRLAEADARFAITAAGLGIVYGLRETQLLYRAVGLSQAKCILFTGERIDAEGAARIGLIDRLTPGPALAAARELAATIAEGAPRSIAGAKGILNALADGAADPHAMEDWMREALESEDYREGVRAFQEKRKPRFTGR